LSSSQIDSGKSGIGISIHRRGADIGEAYIFLPAANYLKIRYRKTCLFLHTGYSFPPYNAIQIEEILQKRVSVGFNEGVFEDMVAPRIAAIAAQEHGENQVHRRVAEIAEGLFF
jgi:hypothetical protein